MESASSRTRRPPEPAEDGDGNEGVGPVQEGEEFPEGQARPLGDAVEHVAAADDPSKVSSKTIDEATEWMLGPDPEEPAYDTFDLNVMRKDGNNWVEHYIPWTVQALDRQRIRAIRRASQSRQSRRGRGGQDQGGDDLKANEMIAAEGTLHPSLKQLAQQRQTNPPMALRVKFAYKPGLIDQIAGKVLEISGYDEDDVREILAGKS